MCCVNFYPNSLGIRISELKPGDEIIILKGEGNPPVPKETATIVWKVSGFSALTVNGVSISCVNLSDLIVTGRQFETYHVTSEALRIWGEVLAARKEAEAAEAADSVPDWSIPPAFGSEPE